MSSKPSDPISMPGNTEDLFREAPSILPEKIRELARRGEAWGDSESRQVLEHAIENGRGGCYLRPTPEQDRALGWRPGWRVGLGREGPCQRIVNEGIWSGQCRLSASVASRSLSSITSSSRSPKCMYKKNSFLQPGQIAFLPAHAIVSPYIE